MKYIVFILVSIFLSNCSSNGNLYLSPIDVSDCVIKSQYYFLPIEFNLDSCLSLTRRHYCEDYLGGGNYGYDLGNSVNSDDIRAIKINSETELANLNKFSNLEFLWIKGGTLVPEIIKDLKNLKILHIQSPNIREIPDWIGDLSQLEVFSINHSYKLEYISPRITELKNLKELYLQGIGNINLRNIDYSKFKNLEKLVNSNSTGLLNESIINCEKLEHLSTRLYHNFIPRIKNLKFLAIMHVLGDTDLKGIHELDELQELVIEGCYGKEYIDENIARLPKLRNLVIDFCNTPTSINEVNLNFENLEYLSITSNDLKEFPRFNMPKLKYLRCIGTNNGNEIEIPKQMDYFNNIKFLKLGGSGFRNFNKETLKYDIEISI